MDACQLVTITSRCQLWSSDNFKCFILRTRSHPGSHAFAAAGPWVWNSLTVHVQPDLTLRQLLVTEDIFSLSQHIVTDAFSALTIKVLTKMVA